jgi:hypothetical protein
MAAGLTVFQQWIVEKEHPENEPHYRRKRRQSFRKPKTSIVQSIAFQRSGVIRTALIIFDPLVVAIASQFTPMFTYKDQKQIPLLQQPHIDGVTSSVDPEPDQTGNAGPERDKNVDKPILLGLESKTQGDCECAQQESLSRKEPIDSLIQQFKLERNFCAIKLQCLKFP